ncbi:MAG: 30S ribosomal protein S3 [Nitrospinae bacterium]|nr:30S ribosomal protein S3 [Nitrospinota bacterium]
MGQKTHPTGFRLGIFKPWLSNWYAQKNYAAQLHEDLGLRKYIKKALAHAGIAKIEIERRTKQIRINIHSARPGIIIGKKGAEVDQLKASLAKMIGDKDKMELSLNILEVRRPELDSQLVAENIALQLEKRIAFRRAMKKSVVTAMRFGAKGIRINCSGRLGGAEIARMEWYREGRVPLHTLRADIDYATAEAHTTFGLIGVKVWLFHGEVIKGRRNVATEAEETTPARGEKETQSRKRDA